MVPGLLLAAIIAFVLWARLTSKTIDGIGCDPLEQVGYHVHAHLTLVVSGTVLYPPAGVGIHYEHLCLYWLHTHDASGIIHIESPRRFTPTLGNFFDIWGQPLSARHVWKFVLRPDQSMKVYVDRKPYVGSPRTVRLRNHTAVTIEIGPPFGVPPTPDFHGL